MADGADWVDVNESRRWRPRLGERLRAAIVLAVMFAGLFAVAFAMSPGGGDGSRAASSRTTTTTVPTSTTSSTTTTAPKAPDSIDGAAPSERCEGDDRGAAALRTPQESTVLVLNGTPRNGHAGATTDRLAFVGYTTVTPDNASIRPITLIEYRPGFCAEAEQLAADLQLAAELALPEVEIAEADPDTPALLGEVQLIVTLGRDSLN